MSRERLFAAFFFVTLGLLLYQLLLFLMPFVRPLAWAAILALTFYPLTTWLVRVFRGSRAVAASVLVLAVLTVAVIPSILLGSLLVKEAAGAYDRVKDLVQSGELNRLIDQLRTSWPGVLVDRWASPVIDALNLDLSQVLLGATSYVSTQIAAQTGTIARNVLESLVSGPIGQMGFTKLTKPLLLEGMDRSRVVAVNPDRRGINLERMKARMARAGAAS